MPKYVDVDVMKGQIHCDYPEKNPLYNSLLKFIDNLPETDVAPVVHAKWTDNTNGSFTCSNCNKKASRGNYCPNCGAKMDGVGDDITFDNIIKEMTQNGAEDS